jgi:hypothetical protein|tara:strand:+ start:979 stop:6612 length:5634 start_codon:yes stop_codon:yes gene_type:complete
MVDNNSWEGRVPKQKNDVLVYQIQPLGIIKEIDLRDNLVIELPYNAQFVTIALQLDAGYIVGSDRRWQVTHVDGQVEKLPSANTFIPTHKFGLSISGIPTAPSCKTLTIQTFELATGQLSNNDRFFRRDNVDINAWMSAGSPVYSNICFRLAQASADITLGSNLVQDVSGGSDSAIGVDTFGENSGIFDSVRADLGVFGRIEADSAYIGGLRADSSIFGSINADSAYIDGLRADSARLGTLYSDSSHIKYLKADSAYISQSRSDILTASIISSDSVSIQNILRVGRYYIDAGEWDSNDLLTDINAIAQENFGGIYYAKADSISGIREKYAYIKFEEDENKWNFFPNINISDLDSDGDSDDTTTEKTPFGAGLSGQFLAYDAYEKKYDWDYIGYSGKFVFDSEQLVAALEAEPPAAGSDLDKLKSREGYLSYKPYSHGDFLYEIESGDVIMSGFSKTNLNFFENHVPIGDVVSGRFTNGATSPINDNIYTYFDSNNSNFKTVVLDSDYSNLTTKYQKISKSINGIISPTSRSDYILQATFSANDTREKIGAAGVVVGFVKDGLKEKTLTVFRSVRSTGAYDSDLDIPLSRGPDPYNFELIYNAGQVDEQLIDIGRLVEARPIHPNVSWDSSGDVVIKIKKGGFELTIETSQFGDSAIDPLTSKKIDLFNNDGIPEEIKDLDLTIFGGPVQTGFAFYNISDATVKDIKLAPGADGIYSYDDNTIFDLRNKKTYLYFDSEKSVTYDLTKGYHNIDSNGFGDPILGADLFTGILYHNPELGTTWYQDPNRTFQIGDNSKGNSILNGIQYLIQGGYDNDKPRGIFKGLTSLHRINNEFNTTQRGLTLSVFDVNGELFSTKNYDIDRNSPTVTIGGVPTSSAMIAQNMASDITNLANGATKQICVITSWGDWHFDDGGFLTAAAKAIGLSKLAAAGEASLGSHQYASVFQLGSKSKIYEVAEHQNSINQPSIKLFMNGLQGSEEFFVLGGEANANSSLTNWRGDIIAETTGNNDLNLYGGVVAATPSTFNSTVNIAIGEANGIRFPDEAFANDANDKARLYLIDSPNETGQQIFTIEVQDDSTDLINLITPESDGRGLGMGMTGLRHNMKPIFSEGYLNIVYDDSPTLGGNLNILDYKIFSGDYLDNHTDIHPTIELSYNPPGNDNADSSAMLSSIRSIHNFIDINAVENSQYFGLWNNKNPYSDNLIDSTNWIFGIRENGDVDVTGKFTTVTTDQLTEGLVNLYYTDSRVILSAHNSIRVDTDTTPAGGGSLAWTPSPDAIEQGVLDFVPALSHSIITETPSGTVNTLAYSTASGIFTFKSALLSDILSSANSEHTVVNATPSGTTTSLSYDTTNGEFTLTPIAPINVDSNSRASLGISNVNARVEGGQLAYNSASGIFTYTKSYQFNFINNSTPSGAGAIASSISGGVQTVTYTPADIFSQLSITDAAPISGNNSSLTLTAGALTYRPAEYYPPISIIDTQSIPSHGEGSLAYDSATGVLTHLRAATVNLLNFRGTTDSDLAEFGKVGTISFDTDSNYGIGTFKLTPGYFATKIDSCLDTTLTIPHATETMGQVAAAVVATKPSVMMLDSSAAFKFSNRRISLGDLVNVADSANAALGFVLTKTHQGYADATPHGSNFEFKSLPPTILLTDLSVGALTTPDDIIGNIVYDNTNGTFSFKPPQSFAKFAGGDGGLATPSALSETLTLTADTTSGLLINASGSTITIDASSVGGFSVDNNSNNRIVTATGTGGNAEENATFDGSTLAITGAITATGNISAEGNVIAAASSDLRLKENLQKIDNALEKVSRLNGYTFTWNEKADKIFSSKNDVGVVAQEVEEVLPEIVIDRVDGYKAVYYEKLVPLLIESIKELKERIEELEKR